jgi:hypothetical protein
MNSHDFLCRLHTGQRYGCTDGSLLQETNMASESSSHTTTDHEEIRRWAEERGGTPASVKGTAHGRDDEGVIRIDFPGYSGEGSLEPISWDDFFEKFEEKQLAIVLQDRTSSGEVSRFNKIVSRSDHGRSDR